jgi:hypothetical protein
MTRGAVVFPDPLWPIRATHSPGGRSRSRPSTAASSPNVLRKPRTDRIEVHRSGIAIRDGISSRSGPEVAHDSAVRLARMSSGLRTHQLGGGIEERVKSRTRLHDFSPCTQLDSTRENARS